MDNRGFENNDNCGGGLPEPLFPKSNNGCWKEFDEFLEKRESVCPFFYYSFTDFDSNGEMGAKEEGVLSYHCYWREYNRCDNSLYLREENVAKIITKIKGEKNGDGCRGPEYIGKKCLGDYSQCMILKKTLAGTRLVGDGEEYKPKLKLEGINIPFKESADDKIRNIMESQIGKPSLTNWYKKVEKLKIKSEIKEKLFMEALEDYVYKLSKVKDHYCLCKNPKKSDQAGFEDRNTDRENKKEYNKRYCMKQFEAAAKKITEEKANN